MADERCYRRGDDPTDLSTDTRYVWDDDVFHGPWCRADAHQPNCIHSAYLRPGDAPEFNEPLGEAATHAELAASFRGRSTLRSDLAAAQAQVALMRRLLHREHFFEAGRLGFTPPFFGERCPPCDAVEEQLASLAKQSAAAAAADADAAEAQVARLTAALEAINELRDGIIRTQTIGWSRTVYPLVKILNDAGILSRVTDDELAPVPPGNRLQRAALTSGEPSAEPSTEE